MLKTYSSFLDALDRVLFVVLAVLSTAMVTVILYQVVLRYCFSAANVWAEELARFMFVWITTLAASMAVRRNVHLKVDLFIDILRPKSRLIVQIISYAAIFVFLVYLCVLGVDLMTRTTINRSAGLRVPMAVPYAAIPAGATLMALSCIEFIAKKVQEFKNLSGSSAVKQ